MRYRWLALLLLTGCITTDPARWAYAPDEGSAARAAIYDCKADTAAMLNRAAAFGGAIVPLVALARARAAFDDCMEARGYRRAE